MTTKFTKRFEIIVGTLNDKLNTLIVLRERMEKTEALKRECARVLGGFTITETTGGWNDATGRFIYDSGLLITCYGNPEDREKLEVLAHYCKSLFNQQCVVFAESDVRAELLF